MLDLHHWHDEHRAPGHMRAGLVAIGRKGDCLVAATSNHFAVQKVLLVRASALAGALRLLNV